MDVVLTRDVDDDLVEGSCIHDVKRVGDSYEGLWTSMHGSYMVVVPANACKERNLLAEAVRNRVLHRFMLGRRSGARIGAGNHVKGVKVLLVGERTSHPELNKHHAPFCSIKGCSGWLNGLLEAESIDEKQLAWINALDNDGTPVDLSELWRRLEPHRVFALGKVAEQQLTKHNVPYTAFAHPQYWKRFKHNEPYPLIAALKECNAHISQKLDTIPTSS